MAKATAFGEKNHRLAQQRFFNMVEVVIGQMLDVDVMTRPVADMRARRTKMAPQDRELYLYSSAPMVPLLPVPMPASSAFAMRSAYLSASLFRFKMTISI